MSEIKKDYGFKPENYKFLLLGLAINVLGFLLMIGGAADSMNDFKEEELFSTTRITIAPILIVAGYVVILWSIMRKKKTNSTEESSN